MGIREVYNRFRYSLIVQGILHFLAMNMPNDKISVVLYRLRGTKIGKNVAINQNVFLEDSRPDLITIEDNVQIGPGVIIATHDSSKHLMNPKKPIEHEKTNIKRNSYIGAGVVVLPGVTIGEFSVVGAGAVVTGDVPPRTIFAGVPARQIGIVTKQGDMVIKKRVE
jgi:acetyltransferase-like isoleucine patch superfamily enzyme